MRGGFLAHSHHYIEPPIMKGSSFQINLFYQYGQHHEQEQLII
jgi:hypothetical protein